MIDSLFTQIKPETPIREVLKAVWNLSGELCPNGPPLFKLMQRSELMYRSLSMIRLMKKQIWINHTLHKHAAVLETMNCTVVAREEEEVGCRCNDDGMGCDCACDCDEDEICKECCQDEELLFTAPNSSGPN